MPAPSAIPGGGTRGRLVLNSLRAKIFAILLVAIGIGVLTSGLVAYGFLQSAYLRLSIDRLGVVAADIRKSLEGNLNLGLSLAAVQDAQAVIERAQADNPGITAISVFDGQRHVLFSTDRSTVGDTASADWLNAGRLTDQAWSHVDADDVIAGAPVMNGFDKPAGGIVIRISRAYVDFKRIEVFQQVAKVAGLFALLAAAAAWIAATLIAQGLTRPLAAAVADIETLRRAEDGVVLPAGDPAMRLPAFAAFAGAVSNAQAALAEAGRTLQQLDEQV